MTSFSFSLVQPSLQTTRRCLVSCYILIFGFASIAASQEPPTWSIQSVSAFALLRVCAQGCLGLGPYSYLPALLDCPSPLLNACVCRTDLASTASSLLTSCVNQGCSSNPADVSSVVSLYDSYCVSNGFSLVTVPASTTAATSFTTVATPGTQASTPGTPASTPGTPTATPTKTPTPTTSTTSPSLLVSPTTTPPPAPAPASKGPLVGGIIAGVAAILLIAGAIVFFIRRKPPYYPPQPPQALQNPQALQLPQPPPWSAPQAGYEKPAYNQLAFSGNELPASAPGAQYNAQYGPPAVVGSPTQAGWIGPQGTGAPHEIGAPQ